MELAEFEAELNSATGVRAHEQNEFQLTAFAEEAASRLVSAEELLDVDIVQFVGAGRRGKKLQVDGYSWEPSTGFLTLVVADYQPPGAGDDTTLSLADARKILGACQGFFVESVRGSLSETLEESTAASGLAGLISELSDKVLRVQIILVTNRRMSDRIKSIESEQFEDFRITYQIWDSQRFFLAHVSGTGREPLEIDFSDWVDGGLRVLRGTTTSTGATSYLALIPAEALAQVYEEYGSRLLEANVRSFLSTRGKVNSGIRQTLRQDKEMFLAYNNGITTTAQSVTVSETSGELRLESVRDWQIVNGGQTTASIASFLRGEPDSSLEGVFVQMKLVVVDSSEAEVVVQSIARFANSQNPVNEADFFSNSPFHRQVEELSARLLAPAKEGLQYQTRWFYERARGQYLNERSKRSGADLRKFELATPRKQVITKTDLAKYFHSWNGLPHSVSQGAQANFLRFAKDASNVWESDRESVNEQYFKDLVSIAILFNSLRSTVMGQSWYENGYLANIVTYSLSKFHHEFKQTFPGTQFDLGRVWREQAISPYLLDELLRIAQLVLQTLTNDKRPVLNVTQWAKQEQCWENVRAVPFSISESIKDYGVSAAERSKEKKAARKTQEIDSGIAAQGLVVEQPVRYWEKILADPVLASSLSPVDTDLVSMMTKPRTVPSEKQAARLVRVLKIAIQNGTIPASAVKT